MQDTTISQLIINKLTREQYEGIENPSDTELYFITDEEETAAGNVNDKITNCILSVPQHFDISISGTSLSLASGSKVYVPNGVTSNVKKYTESTISSTVTGTQTTAGTYFVSYYPSGSSLIFRTVANTTSGTTNPTSANTLFYNTSTNYVRSTNGSGSATSGYSLPLCIVTATSSGIVSIDAVFNGLGYIGSTVFCLPAVTGLIPNGRSADGTLNNTEFTNETVLVNSATSLEGNVYLNATDLYLYNDVTYDELFNLNKRSGSTLSAANVGKITIGTSVEESGLKNPVRLLTTDDVAKINIEYDSTTRTLYIGE